MIVPLNDAAGAISPVFHVLLGLLGRHILPSLVQLRHFVVFLFAGGPDHKL
jgi:hypothetical protein